MHAYIHSLAHSCTNRERERQRVCVRERGRHISNVRSDRPTDRQIQAMTSLCLCMSNVCMRWMDCVVCGDCVGDRIDRERERRKTETVKCILFCHALHCLEFLAIYQMLTNKQKVDSTNFQVIQLSKHTVCVCVCVLHNINSVLLFDIPLQFIRRKQEDNGTDEEEEEERPIE